MPQYKNRNNRLGLSSTNTNNNNSNTVNSINSCNEMTSASVSASSSPPLSEQSTPKKSIKLSTMTTPAANVHNKSKQNVTISYDDNFCSAPSEPLSIKNNSNITTLASGTVNLFENQMIDESDANNSFENEKLIRLTQYRKNRSPLLKHHHPHTHHHCAHRHHHHNKHDKTHSKQIYLRSPNLNSNDEGTSRSPGLNSLTKTTNTLIQMQGRTNTTSTTTTTSNVNSHHYKNLNPMTIYQHPAFNSLNSSHKLLQNQHHFLSGGDSFVYFDETNNLTAGTASTLPSQLPLINPNRSNLKQFKNLSENTQNFDQNNLYFNNPSLNYHLMMMLYGNSGLAPPNLSNDTTTRLPKSNSEPAFKDLINLHSGTNSNRLNNNNNNNNIRNSSSANQNENNFVCDPKKLSANFLSASNTPNSYINKSPSHANRNMRKKSASNMSSSLNVQNIQPVLPYLPINPMFLNSYYDPYSNNLSTSNSTSSAAVDPTLIKRKILMTYNNKSFNEEDLLDPKLIPKVIKKSLIDLFKRSVWNLAHQNLNNSHQTSVNNENNQGQNVSANNSNNNKHKLLNFGGPTSDTKDINNNTTNNKHLCYQSNSNNTSLNQAIQNSNNNNSNSNTSFTSSAQSSFLANVITQARPKNEIKMKVMDNSYV
jgi:hypothetical protein